MFIKLIFSEEKNIKSIRKPAELRNLFLYCFHSFVISAPKVFHVGASETVVIQAHGYTEAFDVTISIRSYPDRKVTYSSGRVNLSPENKFQNSTLLTVCTYSFFLTFFFGKICTKVEPW